MKIKGDLEKKTQKLRDRLGQNDDPKNMYTSNNARAAGLSKTQWDSILRKCSWFK